MKIFNWKKDIPPPELNQKEILCKIDHDCGYIVVIWDDNNKRFIPCPQDRENERVKLLITGISHYCEIFP